MPHIHEKYDFTISCFIVFEGKVLLVNHPRYDMWLCVGGHIELDEDPEQALLREVKEETGLEVEILSTRPDVNLPGYKYVYLPAFISVHEANPPHKHIAFSYYAIAKNSNNVKSDEHSETKWFTMAELDDAKYNLSPEIHHFSKEAIKAAKRHNG